MDNKIKLLITIYRDRLDKGQTSFFSHMNQLENTLQRDLTELSRLKKDLEGVEELLIDKPIDSENIIQSMQ